MTILGIDPSTKSSGFAIFKDNELIHYECITSASQNLFSRIQVMVDGLEKLIKEYQPNRIIIEEVLPEDVKNNQKVFKALIYLQAFLASTCNSSHLIPEFVTASHWRSKCGIHTGRGIKREILKLKDVAFVKNQFGIDVNNDIADAIGIGFSETGIKPKEGTVIKSSGFTIE